MRVSASLAKAVDKSPGLTYPHMTHSAQGSLITVMKFRKYLI